MYNRLYTELKKFFILFFFGLLYYIFNILTGYYIPCLFYILTGLRCPSCGITHMIKAIIRLDLNSAFFHNPFIFLAWPFIFIPLIYSEVNYIKTGKRDMGKLNIFLWFMILLLLLFGIVRNIYNI